MAAQITGRLAEIQQLAAQHSSQLQSSNPQAAVWTSDPQPLSEWLQEQVQRLTATQQGFIDETDEAPAPDSLWEDLQDQDWRVEEALDCFQQYVAAPEKVCRDIVVPLDLHQLREEWDEEDETLLVDGRDVQAAETEDDDCKVTQSTYSWVQLHCVSGSRVNAFFVACTVGRRYGREVQTWLIRAGMPAAIARHVRCLLTGGCFCLQRQATRLATQGLPHPRLRLAHRLLDGNVLSLWCNLAMMPARSSGNCNCLLCWSIFLCLNATSSCDAIILLLSICHHAEPLSQPGPPSRSCLLSCLITGACLQEVQETTMTDPNEEADQEADDEADFPALSACPPGEDQVHPNTLSRMLALSCSTYCRFLAELLLATTCCASACNEAELCPVTSAPWALALLCIARCKTSQALAACGPTL